MKIGAINSISISNQLEITASFKQTVGISNASAITSNTKQPLPNITEPTNPIFDLESVLNKLRNYQEPVMKNALTKFVEGMSNNITTPGIEAFNHPVSNNVTDKQSPSPKKEQSIYHKKYSLQYDRSLSNKASHKKRIWIDILA